MVGVLNADFYGGVKSSLPGGAAGLLKGGAILPTNALKVSEEIPLSLTAGVNADASNSSKGEVTLVDVVAAGSKYALLTASTTSPAAALTPAAAATGAITAADSTPVSANLNRRGLVLVNKGLNGVWLAFGQAAAVDYGIWLAPSGGSFTMDAFTFTTAAVHAYGDGVTTLGIQEFS